MREHKSANQLATQFEVHPNQIAKWRKQLVERAGDVFDGVTVNDAPALDLKVRQAKVGQLALGTDFLSDALTKADR